MSRIIPGRLRASKPNRWRPASAGTVEPRQVGASYRQLRADLVGREHLDPGRERDEVRGRSMRRPAPDPHVDTAVGTFLTDGDTSVERDAQPAQRLGLGGRLDLESRPLPVEPGDGVV